jgi:hypothetical protein
MDKYVHTAEGELVSVDPFREVGREFKYDNGFNGLETLRITERSIELTEERYKGMGSPQNNVFFEFIDRGPGVYLHTAAKMVKEQNGLT